MTLETEPSGVVHFLSKMVNLVLAVVLCIIPITALENKQGKCNLKYNVNKFFDGCGGVVMWLDTGVWCGSEYGCGVCF